MQANANLMLFKLRTDAAKPHGAAASAETEIQRKATAPSVLPRPMAASMARSSGPARRPMLVVAR